MPEQLDVPDLPHEVAYLWGYFLQLGAKRTMGAAAPNPLAESEIEAWERRHRIRLDPFETECIDALDRVYLECAAESAGK